MSFYKSYVEKKNISSIQYNMIFISYQHYLLLFLILCFTMLLKNLSIIINSNHNIVLIDTNYYH